MSALPPIEMRALRKAARAAAPSLGDVIARWADLHAQAGELSHLARLAPERIPSAEAFAARLAAAEDWRRALIWQGLDDIAAILAPGLAALRTLTARGQDPAAPALALWREFHTARAAVLAVLTPPETVPETAPESAPPLAELPAELPAE